MTLVLAITNVERLENGNPTRLTLDRHGAMIGRSPHADWSLPDPQAYISSTHCEIDYRDGAYLLIDKSTNGTFLNGSDQRLAGPHRLRNGDRLTIGQYQIEAQVMNGQAAAEDAASGGTGASAASKWGGWEAHISEGKVGVDPSSWDRPAPRSAISGMGAMSSNWAPPKVEVPPPPSAPAASVWDTPSPPPAQPSGWSSPVAREAPAPSSADIWSQLAEVNVVDWARGGFGEAEPVEAPAWGGSSTPAPVEAPTWGRSSTPAPPPAPPAHRPEQTALPAAEERSSPAAPAPAASIPAARAEVPVQAPAQSGKAEALLRQVVGGLVVMLEARTRAKAQLGAQGTSLQLEGNNPLKFARSPEDALSQLLNPPIRGFMPAETAIEDAFRDLQAHQVATLSAMQGALAATLRRFSPQAIRERAETGGFLTRILPGARDAALWQAYEREFEGVAHGSDEAFMDVFAKEFREAYERASRKG